MKTVWNPIEPVDPEARDIPGWPGYRVTKAGTVWTCNKSNHLPIKEWRRLSIFMSKPVRYPMVNLWNASTRKHKAAKVHILILQTFIGPCPPKMECCHNDGDPLNCTLDNLRWDTKKNNTADTRRHGRMSVGSKHPPSKLTGLDVLEIRKRYSNGETLRSIAMGCGIAFTNVWKIVNRKTWQHV